MMKKTNNSHYRKKWPTKNPPPDDLKRLAPPPAPPKKISKLDNIHFEVLTLAQEISDLYDRSEPPKDLLTTAIGVDKVISDMRLKLRTHQAKDINEFIRNTREFCVSLAVLSLFMEHFKK